MSENRLLKKFLSFSIGSWISMILGFISVPITTRLIMPVEFGKASMFTLAIDILGIIVILGTDQAFIRFYYEEEKENRKNLLYTCVVISFVTFIIIALFSMLFTDKLSMLLFNEIRQELIYILIFGVFFKIINRYAVLVIRMQQKGFLYSLLQIITKVSNVLMLIALALLIGTSYDIVIYAKVTSIIVVAIVAILLDKKSWKINNFKTSKLSYNYKEIIKYSIPFAITLLITYLFKTFDKTALRIWADYEEIGLYSAAFRIIMILELLRKSFSNFWVPVAYEHFKKKPNDKNFFTNMNLNVSSAMIIISLFLIMSKDIIIYLLGPEYREAVMIFPFLVLMPIMSVVSETTFMGINFYKKTKWHLVITIISCITNIAGNALLVPIYGAKGAAISTGLSYILFFILRTHISLKYFKVNYNLGKFYFVTIILVLYAFYSTFVEWTIYNFIAGIVSLIIILFIYKSTILLNINKTRKLINKSR